MKDPVSTGSSVSVSGTWNARAWSALKLALLGLTLEPAILFSNFGRHIVEGNALNLDLLMEKLCVDRFNETQEVCGNLADYPELQDEVQISYNQFETGKKLVGMTPKSVRKKMKAKGFAAAVKREDIVYGAELMETELNDHIAEVIAALQGASSALGFA